MLPLRSVVSFTVSPGLCSWSTPAEKAGLQTGDVIEKIDGTSLNNGQTLGGVLQVHNPGDTVQLTTLRNGGTVQLSLTVGDRPTNGGPAC